MEKKRLIISTAFTLTVIILYQLIDINLFTIDLPRRVSSELFKSLRNAPGVETEIIILDIEYVHLDTVKTYLELLESFQPKSIGINLCNIKDKSDALDKYLNQSKNIVICDCDIDSNKGTSGILTPKNKVTHFKTDKNSYFELQLCDKPNDLKKRGNNKKERINFRESNRYYHAPLSDIENLSPELINGKTILVGFIRDSLVTPMNYWYGRPGDIEGDMSDAQISANIISTINRNEFIDEINPLLRILIILVISLVCTGLIVLLRTKNNIINIVLGLVFLIIFNALSSYLIVFAFTKNYYLELNEVTIVLIISATCSIYWNAKDRHSKIQNTPLESPVRN